MKTHPIAWIVRPDDATLNDEQAMEIRIEDHGAGAFVVLRTHAEEPLKGQVEIDAAHWPQLSAAIGHAVAVAEGVNKDTGEEP